MAITTITVTATFKKSDNTAAAGTVVFRLTQPVLDAAGNVIIAPVEKVVTLDGTGALSVTLFSTDDPDANPSSVNYEVAERITGAPERAYLITVPAASPGGTMDLADAAPVAPAENNVAYVTTNTVQTITGTKTFDTSVPIKGPRPWLDVRAYGATGDGATNDYAAINAALTAAVDGDVIFFPQGTYLVGTQLNVTKKVTLLGFGGLSEQSIGTWIKTTSAIESPVKLAGAGSVIRGLGIDGNFNATYALYVTGAACRIIDCFIVQGASAALRLSGPRSWMYGSRVSSASAGGAVLFVDVADLLIENNRIVVGGTSEIVIDHAGGVGCQYLNNHITGGAVVTTALMRVRVSGTMIVGNQFDAGKAVQLLLDPGAGQRVVDTQIVGNRFFNNTVAAADTFAVIELSPNSAAENVGRTQIIGNFIAGDVGTPEVVDIGIKGIGDANNFGTIVCNNTFERVTTPVDAVPDVYMGNLVYDGTVKPETNTVLANVSTKGLVALGVVGDTEARLALRADGAILIGPGGGTAPDVVLNRDAANVLGMAAGDVFNAPVRRTIGVFTRSNVAANLTAQQLDYQNYAVANDVSYTALRAGSITGILVLSNAARTAGTLTVEVYVAGVATGLTAVLDGTNTTFKATTQNPLVDTYVAGNEIDVRVTTDAAWDPTTADISAQIEVVE